MTAPTPESAKSRVAVPLDVALLDRVLRPYLPHCRYVRAARFEHAGSACTPTAGDPSSWLRLDAQCGIEQSCYIESTGHFNAVELNITYNQMLYLCLAAALRANVLPPPAWSYDEFLRRQLPDVLIADYQARFRRPMRSSRYRGWVEIRSVLARPQRGLLLLKTHSGCAEDGPGGPDACEAQVTIALVSWPAA